MTKDELIREIKDEANRKAGNDPKTDFVIVAKAAIAVIKELDIE